MSIELDPSELGFKRAQFSFLSFPLLVAWPAIWILTHRPLQLQAPSIAKYARCCISSTRVRSQLSLRYVYIHFKYQDGPFRDVECANSCHHLGQNHCTKTVRYCLHLHLPALLFFRTWTRLTICSVIVFDQIRDV